MTFKPCSNPFKPPSNPLQTWGSNPIQTPFKPPSNPLHTHTPYTPRGLNLFFLTERGTS